MDFLLECIGFPPEVDEAALVERARSEGEPAPWRGDPDRHLRLPLGEGLELRCDREDGQEFWTVLPHYRVPHRLRVEVESVQRPAESPFDALLVGWACPPVPGDPEPLGAPGAPGLYRIAAWLTDARRLDERPTPGHVLAVSVAGFGLHVDAVVPNDGVRTRAILDRPSGAFVAPLGGAGDPAGCCDVSLRVRSTRRIRNAVTGHAVELVECDAPERPLVLFVSPWQLERDGLPLPRPGWRVEGTFLFSGRLAGGLPRRGRPRAFG